MKYAIFIIHPFHKEMVPIKSIVLSFNEEI